jgi:hypothetical protein
VDKIKRHLCLVTPPPPRNFAVYEMRWKIIVETGMPQMTIWLMPIPCWLPKATNTFRICNTYRYCFSSSAMVALTRLSITLWSVCTAPILLVAFSFILRSRHSVAVADGPGSNLRGEFLHTLPHRPWDPSAYCTVAAASISLGINWSGRDVNHPPPSSTEVEERVEPYLYSPFGPSWPVVGWTLPFICL